MQRPEEAVQKAIVQYLNLAVSPSDCFWFAVPNQRGTRKVWEMAILSSLGVKAGVSDFVFVLPEGRCAFVEVKSLVGRLSKPQQEFQRTVESLGHVYITVRSVDDIERFLISQQINIKARSGAKLW